MFRRFVPLLLFLMGFAMPLAPALAATPSYEGLSACAYNSAATPITLDASLSQVAQGAAVSFSGMLKNTNAYPIADAAVFAKVFRLQSAADPGSLVAWMPIAEHVTLVAGKSAPLSFVWHVPSGLAPGTYRVLAYTALSGRFTGADVLDRDMPSGASENITIVGTPAGQVFFDSRHATLPPADLSTTTVAAFSVPIVNAGAFPQTLTVYWTLYAGNPLENVVVAQESQVVKLHPASAAAATFSSLDASHAVYTLVGSFTDSQGAPSIITLPYMRAGVSDPALFWAGALNYPIALGNPAAALCVSPGTVPGGETVILSVRPLGIRGLFGNIASASYSGPLPDGLAGLVAKATAGASSFIVTADVYRGQTLTDHAAVTYSCSALGAPCNFFESWYPLCILIGILGIVIIGCIYLRSRRSTV